MNRIDFINLINCPEKVNLQNIGEIKELIDFFPYFQTAHLLLLKGLHNSSDIKFTGQLLSSSVHIANREVLYYLLNAIPDKVSVEEKETVLSEEVIFKSGNEKIEPVKTREDLIGEIEKRLSEIKNRIPEKMDVAQSILTEETGASDSGDIILEIENNEGLPGIEDGSFADQAVQVSSKTDLLDFEYDTGRPFSGISDNNGQQENNAYQHPDFARSHVKISQAELIDKFILANPRIEPVKDKTDLPVVDISGTGHDEKSSFVTETLAKIYINQEYYSRAIDIYEKLSLKFPEKSSYFATQIEKIKGLIKLK
jgi:hypothetical protein